MSEAEAAIDALLGEAPEQAPAEDEGYLSALLRAERAWKSPVKIWSRTTEEQKAWLDVAWRRGELTYKLTPSQRQAYKLVRRWRKQLTSASVNKCFALDISRRWGKSVLLILMALEYAIKHPGSRVVYCAPTFKMVRRILLPLMADMLSDCPPELAPAYLKSEQMYRFSNGSWIELIGLDLDPDRARGTYVDCVLLDETGFFDNLGYLLNSVLKPQMLGRERSHIIAASTPSRTPGHYWSCEMVPSCIGHGAHVAKTLEDADQYTKAEVDAFIAACPGGRNGTTCLREFFVQHIIDDEIAILPEFRDVEKEIVVECKRPQWFDGYTILDPGFNDLAAVLFCYWDFEGGFLYVEDEYAEPRKTSRSVADAIKDKESKLWAGCMRRGHGFQFKPQPFLRFSDNDPSLQYDLAMEHGLVFAGVQKKSLELMVNAVRVALQHKKIRIHPRCVKLIAHCRNGVWKSRKSKRLEFDRPGGEFGHYDLIAALVYAELSVQKHRNPTPAVEKRLAGDLKIKRKDPAAEKRSKWERRERREERARKRAYG